MDRPNHIKLFEVIAALATGLGKLFFMDYLNWKLPFIIAVVIFWSAYVALQSRKEKGLLQHWGFRLDNFGLCLKMILPYAIVSILLFFLMGAMRDSLNMKWYISILLLLYPIWGVIQHFLTIALVSGNMASFENLRYRKSIAIFLSSFLFSAVHFPDKWLMFGTFFLAMFYNHIFLKERNLYALGIFHGVLGAIFYYTLVNRDPFLEVFGSV